VTPPDDAVVEPRCARCQCWLGWVRRIAHEESEALWLELAVRRKLPTGRVSFPYRVPVQPDAHTAYRCRRCGVLLDIDHSALIRPAERARPGKPIPLGVHPHSPANR
jgi:hypothetical protein